MLIFFYTDTTPLSHLYYPKDKSVHLSGISYEYNQLSGQLSTAFQDQVLYFALKFLQVDSVGRCTRPLSEDQNSLAEQSLFDNCNSGILKIV